MNSAGNFRRSLPNAPYRGTLAPHQPRLPAQSHTAQMDAQSRADRENLRRSRLAQRAGTQPIEQGGSDFEESPSPPLSGSQMQNRDAAKTNVQMLKCTLPWLVQTSMDPSTQMQLTYGKKKIDMTTAHVHQWGHSIIENLSEAGYHTHLQVNDPSYGVYTDASRPTLVAAGKVLVPADLSKRQEYLAKNENRTEAYYNWLLHTKSMIRIVPRLPTSKVARVLQRAEERTNQLMEELLQIIPKSSIRTR